MACRPSETPAHDASPEAARAGAASPSRRRKPEQAPQAQPSRARLATPPHPSPPLPGLWAAACCADWLTPLVPLVRRITVRSACRTAFDEFDADGNGLIEVGEFRRFVDRVLGLRLRKPEFSSLWKLLDTDSSGAISFDEFTAVIFPNVELEAPTADGDDDARALADGDVPPRFSSSSSPAARRPSLHGGMPARFALESFTVGKGTALSHLSPESFKRAPSVPPPPSKFASLSQEIRTVGLALSARQDEFDGRLEGVESLLREVHSSCARLLDMGAATHSRHRARRTHGLADKPPSTGTAHGVPAAAPAAASGDGDVGAPASAASTAMAGGDGEGSNGGRGISGGISGGGGGGGQATADGRDDSFFREANGNGAHLPEACAATASKSAPARRSEAGQSALATAAQRSVAAGFTLQDAGTLIVSGYGRTDVPPHVLQA